MSLCGETPSESQSRTGGLKAVHMIFIRLCVSFDDYWDLTLLILMLREYSIGVMIIRKC